MIWLNPWAWWGLAALAVPVAIHLLTRAQPTPLPFPTLRFLTNATSTAVRRRAIKDRALLAVRLGVLGAVVAALAQPALRRASTGAGAPIVRAIVIDKTLAADVARDRAAQITPSAAESIEIPAAHLAAAVAQAAAWLSARGGRGELVVMSPFRRGDLDEADLAPIGTDRGVRLVKIDAPPAAAAAPPADLVAGQAWTPRLALDADRTSVTWTAATTATTAPSFLRVLAGAADHETVAAAVEAATVVGVPAAGAHPIAIVLPGAPEATAGAGPLDEAWMFDVVDALRRDVLLDGAASRVADAPATSPTPAATPLARNTAGSPVVEAASAPAPSGRELRLFVSSTDPLLLAALIAGAAHAEADQTAVRRLEPITVTTDELRRWERPLPSTGVPASTPNAGAWLGRWFWIAALALLGLETWMRRSAATPAAAEVTHARVA